MGYIILYKNRAGTHEDPLSEEGDRYLFGLTHMTSISRRRC